MTNDTAPAPAAPVSPPPKSNRNRNLAIGCGGLILVLLLCGVLAQMGGGGSPTTPTVTEGQAPAVSGQQPAAGQDAAATEAPVAEATEAPAYDVGTRENPVPIGQSSIVGDWEIAVVTVNPNAADIVAAENQFNDPPAAGYAFVLVGIKATYNGDETGIFWVNISDKILGNGGNSYDESCGVVPNQVMDAGEAFPGASIEANLCFAVETAQLPGATLILEPSFSFSDKDRRFFTLE